MTKTPARTRTRAEAPVAAAPVELTAAERAANKKASKIAAAAQGVLDWATTNYASKTYAWNQLVETTSLEDIIAELREANITTTAKALTHYRAIAKLWAETQRGHDNEAAAGQ